MDLVIHRIVESVLLPPGGLLLVLVMGLLLARRWSRLSGVLVWGAVVGLYVASSGVVVIPVMRALEVHPPLDMSTVAHSGAQAIVVLSANQYPRAPEYGRDTIGGTTLQRLRYGAYLHRHTALPLLVSGGRTVNQDVDTLAAMMADVLAEAFGIEGVWQEAASRNTWENAKFSHALLAEKGVGKVILVTHASHMLRAVEAFEQAGLEVVPAPTAYQAAAHRRVWFEVWLPSRHAMAMSASAAHELLGLLWYRLRYY